MKINWSNLVSGTGAIVMFASAAAILVGAAAWGILTIMPGFQALAIVVAIFAGAAAIATGVVMAPMVHSVEPFFEHRAEINSRGDAEPSSQNLP